MIKEKMFYRILFVLATLAFMWTSFNTKPEIITVELPVVEQDLTIDEVVDILSFEDSVYLFIKELNIKHPELVYRQARLESGNFQSRLFKTNSNMFGMKPVYRRPTTQIGEKNGYGNYNHWKMSIIDYAIYQAWSAKNLTEEQYINFLSKNYAEDPKYSQKLRK